MEKHRSKQISLPVRKKNTLGIVATILASVALIIALSSLALSIYNTIRLPSIVKSYVSSNKDELRGAQGPQGPQGYNGNSGRDGANGSNGLDGSNSSSPTYCSTYNSGSFGSVNCF